MRELKELPEVDIIGELDDGRDFNLTPAWLKGWVEDELAEFENKEMPDERA